MIPCVKRGRTLRFDMEELKKWMQQQYVRLLTDFPMKKKSDDARHNIEGWQSKNERIESLLNVLYAFRFNTVKSPDGIPGCKFFRACTSPLRNSS